jgi:fatty-acyl-CoA synthase
MSDAATSLCISSLLEQAVARYSDATALITTKERLSYRQLDEQSRQLAGYLQANGIRRGERIALHLRNSAEYVIADLAILKLNAVKVPLNELMAPSELEFCLKHSKASAIISHASLPIASGGTGHLKVRISVADEEPAHCDWTNWTDAASHIGTFEIGPAPEPRDIALIAYTGGTTGNPKGVQHEQHGLAVNLLAHVIFGDIRSDEVMLLTTPLPHSAGYHLQACLLQGGLIVLAPRFDPESFLALAEKYKATWTFAVPTMLYRLLDYLSATQQQPSCLRTIVYGAAPMNKERLTEGLDVLGPVFLQLFGQTECPNYITTLSKIDHLNPELLASCGRPVAMLDLRIRKADGSIAEPGEVGEVEVRSPYNLTEYFEDPEATRLAIKKGWLRTGDLGYLNRNRYLFLVDRAKDMIISGGMNVYCVEVEAALRQHPSVRDAAVIGMPDPDWGEAVIAFITMITVVSESDVREFAKTLLSGYKVPKQVIVVESLPVTKFGKIDKKALRSSLSLRV